MFESSSETIAAAFGACSDGTLVRCTEFAMDRRYVEVVMNSSGTLVAMADSIEHAVHVYEFPSMTRVATFADMFARTPASCQHGNCFCGICFGVFLDLKDTCMPNPHGMCFGTDDTLWVADTHNDRVQHWALDGTLLGSISSQYMDPIDVAVCGDMIAIAYRHKQTCQIRSISTGDVLYTWSNRNIGFKIAFGSASTLLASCTAGVGLHALDGTLLKMLNGYSVCWGLAACADGTLLVSDKYAQRVHVFTATGDALPSAPLSKYDFTQNTTSIMVSGARAFVVGAASAAENTDLFIYEFQ